MHLAGLFKCLLRSASFKMGLGQINIFEENQFGTTGKKEKIRTLFSRIVQNLLCNVQRNKPENGLDKAC